MRQIPGSSRISVSSSHDSGGAPSPWVQRFAGLIPAGGRVLDLACGGGRHTRFLAALGCAVEAVDRDAAALATLEGLPLVSTHTADLEHAPWPYDGQRFDAIVVTHYLHRPLFAPLASALGDSGVLIYETFAAGNERYGRPANPDFLLQPGELLRAFAGLHVVAYEDGYVDVPKPAMVQRLCAIAGMHGTARL
jgi:SAM-dependent methyltransferase